MVQNKHVIIDNLKQILQKQSSVIQEQYMMINELKYDI